MAEKEIHRNSITRGVVKAMGLFTGVEFFNILCSMVKMRLVTQWLGAVGVGLFGIYNTTFEMVSVLAGLGIRQSGVREVAVNRNNRNIIHRVIARVRGWSAVTGLLGAVALLVLSPFLALLLFGNTDNWWHFVLLGVAVFLSALTGGEQAILQGLGSIKRIGIATLKGSVLGLAASIPMFRWMGDNSVIYSIVAYAAAILFFLLIGRPAETYSPSPTKTDLKEGRKMVSLGAFMAIATFTTSLTQILFLSYLNREASPEMVGYYQGGATIVIRYTAVVFTAVGVEFYPRLAAHYLSRRKISVFVSHEISLLILVFTPLLLLFLCFKEPAVSLLYTDKFLVIIPYVTIGILAIIFRAVSSCMAYTIVARGDGKTYLFTEVADAIIGLTLNIVLYRAYGLTGTGIALVLWYFIYTLITGFIYHYRYSLRLGKETLKAVAISVAISLVAVCSDMLWESHLLLKALYLIVAAVYLKKFLTFTRGNKQPAGNQDKSIL